MCIIILLSLPPCSVEKHAAVHSSNNRLLDSISLAGVPGPLQIAGWWCSSSATSTPQATTLNNNLWAAVPNQDWLAGYWLTKPCETVNAVKWGCFYIWGQLYGFADLTQCMWILPVRLLLTIFIEALLLLHWVWGIWHVIYRECYFLNRPKYFSWKRTPYSHYWFGQVPSCLTPTA